ncbi:MAG TPA: MqnA/MqnD/SBP family protein, partial [Chroococcales cyanobacterium]
MRIGEPLTVSALPIYQPFRGGLLSDVPDIELVSAPLDELCERMLKGDLDASPISIIDYVRYKDRFDLLPGVSISSWGRSGSTLLCCRGPLASLEAIAVPEEFNWSHWSQWGSCLARWLLKSMYGTEPAVVMTDGELSELLLRYNAVLISGQAAFNVGEPSSDTIFLDLGDAWWQATQTPLVHIVWAVSKLVSDEDFERVSELMGRAKERMEGCLPTAIQAGSEMANVSHSQVDG